MIGLLLTLAVCGFVLWIILQIPMPSPFRTAIVVIATILLILWLVQLFGIGDIPIPRFRR